MFDPLLEFFSEITSLQRGGLLALGLMFFWIIEGFLPFRYLNYNKFKHALNHLKTQVNFSNFLINAILVTFNLC